ncbi:MAG: CoA pyrophosphatase [Pseudomonadota bacterium]
MAERSGDQRLNPDYEPEFATRTYKPAAVLFAVLDYQSHATVLLTQRSSALSSHSGQIAFPGGKIDDGETAEQAALREAEEEVGLDRSSVEVLGTLGPYFSGSGYVISPVLGIVRGRPQLTISPDEVDEAFEVPLQFLMDQNAHRVESLTWKDKERFFFAMPWRDETLNPPVDRRIWGVTAGIIRTVQERLYED